MEKMKNYLVSYKKICIILLVAILLLAFFTWYYSIGRYPKEYAMSKEADAYYTAGDYIHAFLKYDNSAVLSRSKKGRTKCITALADCDFDASSSDFVEVFHRIIRSYSYGSGVPLNMNFNKLCLTVINQSELGTVFSEVDSKYIDSRDIQLLMYSDEFDYTTTNEKKAFLDFFYAYFGDYLNRNNYIYSETGRYILSKWGSWDEPTLGFFPTHGEYITIVSEEKSSSKTTTEKCPNCNGTGTVKYYYGSSALEAALSGHDDYSLGPCGMCNGSGYTKKSGSSSGSSGSPSGVTCPSCGNTVSSLKTQRDAAGINRSWCSSCWSSYNSIMGK